MNYPEQQSWEWGTQIRASNRFRQMQSLVSQQSNLIQYHGEKSDFSVMILDQLDIYIQFSSVAQLGPTLCNPMNCSTPGLPVHHQLPESTQTHVHWVGDAIQPSHPLLSPSQMLYRLSHQGSLTMEYYSAIKENKVRPFTEMWMDLEIIILSEVSLTKKDKYYMVSLIFGI